MTPIMEDSPPFVTLASAIPDDGDRHALVRTSLRMSSKNAFTR